MTEFPAIRGGFAFFLSTSHSHLHVVVNDPHPTTNQVVIANLTTRYPGTMDPVVLQAGEHPFVQHDTTLAFERAILRPVDPLQQALREGQIIPHSTPFSTPYLQRFCWSLIAARDTPQEVKDFLISL